MKNVGDALVITFDDGRQFTYPAHILYDSVPQDETLARRVQELLISPKSKSAFQIN